VVEILRHVNASVSSIADIASGGGAYIDAVKKALRASRAQVVAVDRRFACVAGYRMNHSYANRSLQISLVCPFCEKFIRSSFVPRYR